MQTIMEREIKALIGSDSRFCGNRISGATHAIAWQFLW